jgi:hypothetical protein
VTVLDPLPLAVEQPHLALEWRMSAIPPGKMPGSAVWTFRLDPVSLTPKASLIPAWGNAPGKAASKLVRRPTACFKPVIEVAPNSMGISGGNLISK